MCTQIKALFIIVSILFFTFQVQAQKTKEIAGSWKVDYETTKAAISAEDKANFTAELEQMMSKMMGSMKFVFDKSGKYELYIGEDKVTTDNAKWELKGKTVVLTNLKSGSGTKEMEVKETSKSKLVLYDKNENGPFKTMFLIRAE